MKNITQMEEQIESLRKEFNEKIEALRRSLADKPTAFEKGKWYYGENEEMGGFIILCNECSGSTVYGPWIRVGGKWTGESMWKGGFCNNTGLRPATPSEIESALIREAEKRGFKRGLPFSCINGVNINGCLGCKYGLEIRDLSYNEVLDSLESMGGCVYCKGQWAEIIKEVTVAGEKVEYVCGYVKIGGQTYSRADVEAAARVLALPRVCHITVEACTHKLYTISKVDVQSILDNWK